MQRFQQPWAGAASCALCAAARVLSALLRVCVRLVCVRLVCVRLVCVLLVCVL